MESQNNPFLPPSHSEIPTRERRRFEVNPLRSLENSLGAMATFSLAAFGLICLLVLGFWARAVFVQLYHISLLACIPLGWVAFMLPVHVWNCAGCCTTAPGRWAGRFSVLAIPVATAVTLMGPAPAPQFVMPLILPLVVAGFSGMLIDIAARLDSEKSKIAAGGIIFLAAALAGIISQRQFTQELRPAMVALGVLVVANTVIVFRLRFLSRRAHRAEVSVPLSGKS